MLLNLAKSRQTMLKNHQQARSKLAHGDVDRLLRLGHLDPPLLRAKLIEPTITLSIKKKPEQASMKKLYNNKGPKRIHPSPLSSSSSSPSSNFSCLPTALLALASTLSPKEQEVLIYLLNSEIPMSKKLKNKQKAHSPQLDCSCFGCYKSYWVLWDASPNRHVIHTILDALEEMTEQSEKKKSKKKRGLKKKDDVLMKEFDEKAAVAENGDEGQEGNFVDNAVDVIEDDEDASEEEDEEEDKQQKSSVKRFITWVFGNN